MNKKRNIDLLFITSCISTGLVLLLVGTFAFILLGADHISRSIKENTVVEIVLSEGVSAQDRTSLENKLKKTGYCRYIEYISKEKALETMTESLGVNPQDFLDYNPFYASYNIRLVSDYANADSLAMIEESLTKEHQVYKINYQKQLVSMVGSNLNKILLLLVAVAVLMSLVSFSLINNTIKLTVYAQRFLLYSMKLVGAKWSFIRRPFLRRNMLVGVISAILACVVIYAVMTVASRWEPTVSTLMSPGLLFPVFAVVLAMGLVITCICTLCSVNKFLRMKSGELFCI